MRINYDFSDLEAFLAVMDTGSFHVAASKLNLSQSAITRRIAKLEQALDSLLFARTTRSVKPTLAAKRLYPRAEGILDQATETNIALRDESIAYAHQRNAIITVAAIPTLLTALVLPAVKQLQADGGRYRVQLLDKSSNEVGDAVSQGEADFGISSVPYLDAGTEFETLLDDTLMLAVHPDKPLANLSRITWRDISQQELILPARGTGNRLLIDDAFARLRSPVAWTYEVGRTTSALEMVSNNVGVALVPMLASISAAAETLKFLPVTDPEIRRPVGLLYRAGSSNTTAVSKLMQCIREVAKLRGEDLNL
jgi:DNA-binding transcriptional LysR family regulator